MASSPDPRPQRDALERRTLPEAVLAKMVAERACRACGTGAEEPDPHHLVLRSHGGHDTVNNMVPLCRPCHRRFHSSPSWTQVASGIRRGMTAAERAYVVATKGAYYLERYYPLVEAAAL